MPRDYKDAPAARSDSRLNHPLLLGMIIGLLLGIVISLAVALWLNRLSNPFVDKGKPIEPLPRMGPAQPPPPPDAAKAAEKAAKGSAPEKGGKPGDRPRFEFYNILPGEKEGPDREAQAPAKAAAPSPPAKAAEAAPKPGSSPSSPKPHSGEVYWLQAGAFSDEKEADNLRAKIALTGLEASVRAVAVPEKGKLYRVRLGPYQSLDDANRMKTTLSQNGVGAAIIRTGDEAANP
ncbi:MAG TPA: SPOR domain-containing protein [Usitatibacter sp.]|jgi:cell division protein FtsN|nr:SPOR domain-containing protein [Usitatibacter sp.]